MKKHHPWRRLASLFLCLALLCSLAVPAVRAEEAEPVSLTGNAKVSAYTIADPANYYNNNSSIGYITEIEEASYGRLLDGVTADQVPEKFDEEWVGSAWNDPNGGRYLFLNLYRGVSRDITIDLGEVHNVTELDLHVGVSSDYGVPGPTSVDFYLSENGTDFYLAGTVSSEDVTTYSVDIYKLEHADYVVSDLNYNARYVRLQFPVSVWVFLDELYVNGYTGASENADDLTELERLITEVSKESYSTTEQSGGIMNDFLSYQGWGTVNGELTETYKTVREYEAIVAYLDEEGVPQDWLYDAVTLLGHASTSDGGVYLVSGTNTDYATKADWAEWVDHIYDFTYDGEVTNLDALDEAVGNIKSTMVPNELNGLTESEIADYVVPVRLSVYPAIHAQSDWGTLEAGDTYINVTVADDGTLSFEAETLTESKAIDFTLAGHGGDVAATLSDRASAFYWYMDLLADRWDAKGYENLELHGFYYYEEKASESIDELVTDTIKLYNMLVNQLAEDRGVEDYSSYWIPFYTADGTKYWQELGFDYAVMQPNAYNYGQSRLNSAADYAYFYGMGLEMEWMGNAQEGYVDTFIQYLTTGAAKGYQSAPSAWYWGTWDLPRLCYNEGAVQGCRYVYDLVYEYISGNAIYSENILASAEVSLNVRQVLNQDTLDGYDLTVLTDGVLASDTSWGSGKLVQINTGNAVTPPFELVAKLAETTAITELSSSYFDWTSAGVVPPYEVDYFVSDDGESWLQVGQTFAEDDYTLTIEDGAAANYVKAVVYCAYNTEKSAPYGWLGIAEFSAKGTATTRTPEIPALDTEKNLAALEDAVYTLTDSEGNEVPASNSNDLKATLTDGTVKGAWNAGYYCFYDTSKVDPFSLVVDLGEDCYIDGISLNFYSWVSAGVAPPEQVSFYTSLNGESWTFMGIVTDPVEQDGTASTDPTDLTFVQKAAETATARYVKVEFSRGGNKYSQIEKSNWIAFSELVIEGKTLSNGLEYLEENVLTLTEDMLTVDMLGEANANGETGRAAVDAAKGVLVDGLYGDTYPWAMNAPDKSAYVGFQGGWEGAYDESAYNKGWLNNGYYVQLNLGKTYDLSGVAMDFLRNNPSGIGGPDDVTVLVSLDGENWTDLGVIEEAIVSPCTNPTHEKLYYVMELENVTARYVRFEFKRSVKDENNVYSFVCFDEIVVSGTACEAEALPMYRMYNPNSGEHFFTGNETERDNLIGYGWKYEGIAFYAPTEGDPVYRVYNPNSGDHHYTTYWEEVEMLRSYGWNYEGIGWHSADETGVPQYRLWNPNADLGSHHYTGSEEERDILIGYGWKLEGIGWYSCKTGDELENLALSRLEDTSNYEYVIAGGGTGYDSTGTMHEDGTRYTVSELENESLPRLTDGVMLNDEPQHFATGWEAFKWNDLTSQRSKYVEFYRNDSRYLTIDLGQVSNIQELSMHFGAVDGYGIYLPVEVTYYLSENGTDYYKVGTVDVEDALVDENDARNTVDDGELMLNHAYYSVSDISYNARYVKIVFPVNVYTFSDEIIVMGTKNSSTEADSLTSLEQWDPNAGVVNHYATYEQAGGVHNEYMAYSGWYIYSDDETRSVAATHKTQAEYLSAVAYVQQDGTIADWMFDDITVMGHEYTAQGTYNAYHEGHTDASEYATKEDWQQWLNYAFGMDAEGNALTVDAEGTVSTAADGEAINLVALDAAVAQAKEALGDPDYKVGVKLVMWPAVHVQNNWGELDGKTIDFTIEGAGSKAQAVENRLAAVKWYVDLAIQMWEEAGFENLELTGFYYYEETIRMSSDRAAKATAQAITEYVKSVTPPSTNTEDAFSADAGRLYIYWLPYYQSEGFTQWAEFGFDYALMQPNYAFYDIYTVQQLYECGDLCETYGLGMQMEFGGINKGYIRKFQDYLTYGGEIGYQNTVLSWYMSTYGCYQTSQNEENTRYLYDAIYQFINGNSVSFDDEDSGSEETTGVENLALEKIPTFEYAEEVKQVTYWTVNEINNAMGLLTDGDKTSPNWWVNSIDNYYIGIDTTCITGPYAVTLDLEDTYTLTKLAIYFYDRTDWGVGTTQSVEYFVSADGETWTSVGTVSAKEAIATEIEDTRNPNEQAPTIYAFELDVSASDVRYVKVAFAGDHPSVARLGIGELEVYGCKPENVALEKAPTFKYEEEVKQVNYWTVNEINGAMGLLTDGEKFSPNWWVNSIDNYYIGINTTYITGPYAVNLDLEESYNLTKLAIYFYDRTSWGVGTTQSVEYFVSADGETWTSVGTVSVENAIATEIEDTRNPNDQAPTIYAFELDVNVSDVRYVKVAFAGDHPDVSCVSIGEMEVYGYLPG